MIIKPESWCHICSKLILRSTEAVPEIEHSKSVTASFSKWGLFQGWVLRNTDELSWDGSSNWKKSYFVELDWLLSVRLSQSPDSVQVRHVSPKVGPFWDLMWKKASFDFMTQLNSQEMKRRKITSKLIKFHTWTNVLLLPSGREVFPKLIYHLVPFTVFYRSVARFYSWIKCLFWFHQ